MCVLICSDQISALNSKGRHQLNLRTEDLPVEFESSHGEPLSVDLQPHGPPRSQSFEGAIDAFEAAILADCPPDLEWPAMVAGGIRAALAFAAANPDVARTLTVDSRADEPEEADDYLRVIGRFADLLGEDAPHADRLPASSDRAVVCAIVTIVSHHLRAGTIDRLSQGSTDMIFLVLLPYVGFHEASRWSAPA